MIWQNSLVPIACTVAPNLYLNSFQDGRVSYEEFVAMMKTGTDWRKASRQYSRERFKSLSLNLMKDGSLQLHDGMTGQAIAVWFEFFIILFSSPFSFLIIYIHENMVCGGFHQMWVLGIRLGEGEHWIFISDTGEHGWILAVWIMQQVAVNCWSCQAFPEFVEVCVTVLEWVSHILVYWCHVFQGWWFGI